MTAPDIGYARMCANVIHANIIPEVIGPYIICLAGKTWRVWRHGRLSPVVVVVAAVAANGMLERTEGETHISHTHRNCVQIYQLQTDETGTRPKTLLNDVGDDDDDTRRSYSKFASYFTSSRTPFTAYVLAQAPIISTNDGLSEIDKLEKFGCECSRVGHTCMHVCSGKKLMNASVDTRSAHIIIRALVRLPCTHTHTHNSSPQPFATHSA